MEDGIENTILKVNCIHRWKISDRTLIKHGGNISTDWESGREWTYSSPLPTCQFFSLHFGKNTLIATTPSPVKSVIKVNRPLAMGGPWPKRGHQNHSQVWLQASADSWGWAHALMLLPLVSPDSGSHLLWHLLVDFVNTYTAFWCVLFLLHTLHRVNFCCLHPTSTDKKPTSDTGHYLETHFTDTAAAKKDRCRGLVVRTPRLRGRNPPPSPRPAGMPENAETIHCPQEIPALPAGAKSAKIKWMGSWNWRRAVKEASSNPDQGKKTVNLWWENRLCVSRK